MDLNYTIELCEKLSDIDQVYNDISSEVELPIKNQKCTNNLYYVYKGLKEKLKKLSNNLGD